jgi:CHAD domain-containing protein
VCCDGPTVVSVSTLTNVPSLVLRDVVRIGGVGQLTSHSEVTIDHGNVGTFLRELLLAATNEIEVAETVVRDNKRDGVPDDPESIRKLRLAFRRVLYRLEMMSDVEESLSSEDLLRRLQEVGEPLGELRDAEILEKLVIDALGDRIGSLQGRELVEIVTELRRDKQLSADTMIHSTTYQDVLKAMAQYRSSLQSLPVSTLPIRPIAQRVMYVSWHKLQRAVRKTKRDASDAQLHRLRITAKRTMYAAQAFEDWPGTPTKRFATRLDRLQKRLGDQHDHVVASAWIRQVAKDHPSLKRLTKTLSAKERTRADRCAKGWGRRWKSVRQVHPVHFF